MANQKTDKGFNVSEGTSGAKITAKQYEHGDVYVSQKSHRNTEEYSSGSKYISGNVTTHVSSCTSRSFEKTSEINKRLKELSR